STWTWSNWKFTEFGYPCFLNFGKNYSGARDDYVYMYSPDTPDAYDETDSVILVRVLKSQITDKNAYEFFQSLDNSGNPVWTSDISQRGAVFNFPGGCNRLDVVYNAPLQRYIMTMRSRAKAGGLNQFSIYDAPEPWGPWTTVYYETQTSTTSGGWGESQHFPYKWISSDGKTMYSVFSGDDAFSVRKATLTVTVGADTIPPYILNVSAVGDSTGVLVTYSEPVEETSATDIGNYQTNHGVTVLSATILSDSSTVALTTSPHTAGIDYTLTVNNVFDRAAVPNSIAANTQVVYQYIPAMIISNINVASGRNYIIENNLQIGEMAYIDRNYTYQNIPSSLNSNDYIRTANDDKLSQGIQFLSFDVNQPVTVYVCHDNRYELKPDWLMQFSNTQQSIYVGSAVMTVFGKDFPAGTITLGGNVHPQETENNNMYTVIIAPQGVTGITGFTKLPSSNELEQNYPNPANPATTIPYQLQKSRHVQLSIYNLLGQKIRDLVSSVQGPGEFKVEWDGKDRFGRDAPSGIYFYRLKTGVFEKVKRLTLIR
ncbi:MAG: T9SS type A sorting domain-containing protein, partial [Calditrichia bacterium]